MTLSKVRSALHKFKACADEAPEGCFEEAKGLNALISETCSEFIKGLRALGLKADNCDKAFDLEESLYDYAKWSNPQESMFSAAESFGALMDQPERERVLAEAVSLRDYVRKFENMIEGSPAAKAD